VPTRRPADKEVIHRLGFSDCTCKQWID